MTPHFLDLPRLRRHDAGRSARRRRDDSVVARAFRQSRRRAAMPGAGRPKPRSRRRASEVAALVGADPREIIWTSGATESDNLALKGAAQFYKSRGKHLITVKTEHKAVLDTMRELERQGFRGDVSRRSGRRPARPRQAQGGVSARHHPGLGDVRQQRDRRHPGHRGDRRDVPRARRHLPRRCGAGHRQGRRSTWPACRSI